MSHHKWIPATMLAVLAMSPSAFAQESASTEEALATLTKGLDSVFVLLSAFLVFFMNVGFGCVESGFCRAKNAVNILGKNFVVFGLASLSFYIIGYGLMFSSGNPIMGTSGWMLGDVNPADNLPQKVFFFFQLAFAATAATIVSGCVAERIHYGAYMALAFVLVAILYPITGHWVWGGGFLSTLGTPFHDFAGSTVVHSVGGWAGLAGILLLGPRSGKFPKSGGVHPIPGHSMALVFLGGLILWLGWFGFNPGSNLAIGDGSAVAHIVLTTNMSAAAGLVAATIVAWLYFGKPDFSMTVNGCLAGLVAITAGCDVISVPMSIVVGAIAGALVVFSVVFFDKIRIDDPVGALSVHLACGIWGTLAVGIFGGEGCSLGSQIVGIIAVGLYTFIVSLIVWAIIKATIGLRVSQEVESLGLDISEMGMEAYPEDPFPG
ncbi:ammonium transporter [Candidatus Sumerlaeota bacterium]|nr:ammonium transporter [Candidatus Sumerlaeota bacterium]